MGRPERSTFRPPFLRWSRWGARQVSSPNWDSSRRPHCLSARDGLERRTGWGRRRRWPQFPVLRPQLSDGSRPGRTWRARLRADLRRTGGALRSTISRRAAAGPGDESIASPLSAGFFALIASRVGCRLGDVHPARCTRLGGRSSTAARRSLPRCLSPGRPPMTASLQVPRPGRASTRSPVGGRSTWRRWRPPGPPCSHDGGIFDAGVRPALRSERGSDLRRRRCLHDGPGRPLGLRGRTATRSDAGSCAGRDAVCSGQTPLPGRDVRRGLHSRQRLLIEERLRVPRQPSSALPREARPPRSAQTSCAQATDCPSGASCFTSPGFPHGRVTARRPASWGARIAPASVRPARLAASWGSRATTSPVSNRVRPSGRLAGRADLRLPAGQPGVKAASACRSARWRSFSGWHLRHLRRPEPPVQL